ncbi:MAG: translation initiation factor IF-2 [Holosporales bacterium]|jgi:translation initiation factor IF-2|nr:translation initiation factor IF-2 [Holosporales bacterium]
MVNDSGSDTQNRKTLSLKSAIDVSSKETQAGSRTLQIEIKKKKHGLTIEVEENDQGSHERPVSPFNPEDRCTATGKLTDREFQARVRAVQDAMKEDVKAPHTTSHPAHEDYYDDDPVESAVVAPPPVETHEAPSPTPETPEKREVKYRVQKTHKEDVEVIKNTEPVVFRSDDYYVPSPPSHQKVQQPEADPKRTEHQFNNKPKHRDTSSGPQFAKKPSTFTRGSGPDKKYSSGHKTFRNALDRGLDDEFEGRARSMGSLKRARMKQKNADQSNDVAKVVREVSIPDSLTVGELSNRMAVKSAEVIRYLMSTGTMATVNQVIDGDTAEIICEEFGHIPKRSSASDIEDNITSVVDNPEDLTVRPPVVAVMGHVDHGKTTLLDAIRRTSIARKEAGGITQCVAAYQIISQSGKKITFIDTPGHAAFSEMRARGAVITDIIVLVVAADDGIKEQTIEVIRQAKAQDVPIVVAINKIDRPNINVHKLKSELMVHEVVLEDFGGDVLSAEISALQNTNLTGLIETILLQAEMLELKANKHRNAVGTVLESRVDKGKGIISSVIIQHGTLSRGDVFVAGSAYGKVRMLFDDKGDITKTATPSDPVEIVGFNSPPEPGDTFAVVDTEQKAKEIAEHRKNLLAAPISRSSSVRTIDQMMSGEAAVQTLNIFVKADVYGSLEAIVASIEGIHHDEVKANVVEKGVGIISESDIDFAKNTNSVVIGFNTNVTVSARNLAKLYGIRILSHNIIYHMTEEVKELMSAMLAPIVEERYIGTADVRKIFSISRLGTIAGCYVTDGIIKRNDSKVKVMRDNKCIFEGRVKSMKHEKDEIKESRQSHECGILADGFNDFVEGDQIECYEMISRSRSVD